jgi:3-oxosteroid 1-dehydrogenase
VNPDGYDFICLGAGIGGLSGAIAAAGKGLSVAVFEKSDKVGGVAALSRGEIWAAGTYLEEEAGLEDSPEAGFKYLSWLGGGYADLNLTRQLCHRAPEVLQFLRDRAKVEWQLFRNYPDYYWPSGDESRAEGRYVEVKPILGCELGPWQYKSIVTDMPPITNDEYFDASQGDVPSLVKGSDDRLERDERTMGGGLMAYLIRAAIDMGVEVVTEADTLHLIQDGGSVVGVDVAIRGERRFVRSEQGILLATSGYDWDSSAVRGYDARPFGGTRVPPTVTGDHLRLAGSLGARIGGPGARPQIVSTGIQIPGYQNDDGTPRWWNVGNRLPHSIWINRLGRRFCDETFGPAYSTALGYVDPDVPGLLNQPFWMIFDSQYRARYPIGPFGTTDVLPPMFISGSSLAELADGLGVDSQELGDTVRTFNEGAALGVDPLYGRGSRPLTIANGDRSHKPNPSLGEIRDAPFYAVELQATAVGMPSVGLVADVDARVLDWADRPLEGLYVAGNSMAMLDLGLSYNSGLANTRGAVFGFLAGSHAAVRSRAAVKS